MKLKIIIMLSIIPSLIIGQDIHKAYSKFDFIPGNEIIYFTNFDGDLKGELPKGWNTNGSGELVSMHKTNWIKLMQNATFITDNTQQFSDNFTVEFDLFLDFKGTDALFPQVSFGILSSGTHKPNSNKVLQNIFQHQLVGIDFNIGIENNSITKLISYNNGSEYFNSGEKPFKEMETLLNKVVHISMQVQQQRFRLWVNEIKLFDVPDVLVDKSGINQLFFQISQGGFSNEQVGIYVTNLKVAKGVPDVRAKLFKEGKFSTTGIHFNVSSAEIKPASYPLLKEIGSFLKENNSTKILIVGHTDADGQTENNLQLSKQRSESVKKYLVEVFGVNGTNISTDGKGETQPLGDNKTKEGKAQNRRVEFIIL